MVNETKFKNLQVGNTITVERQAVYATKTAPAYKVTTRTITAMRSIDADHVLISWGKGKNTRSFRMTLSTGYMFGNYCNRPTRYQIIEVS